MIWTDCSFSLRPVNVLKWFLLSIAAEGQVAGDRVTARGQAGLPSAGTLSDMRRCLYSVELLYPLLPLCVLRFSSLRAVSGHIC